MPTLSLMAQSALRLRAGTQTPRGSIAPGIGTARAGLSRSATTSRPRAARRRVTPLRTTPRPRWPASAQALATVADQDVVEPAFVVDYGVEPEPMAGTFVDPFGGDPAPEPDGLEHNPSQRVAPQLHATKSHSTQPGDSRTRSGGDRSRCRLVPGPVHTSPTRLWDGTRWTERVADNGVEGIDPVPGAPATSAAATQADDTATAAWSAQLLSGADVDSGTLPVAPDAGDPQMTAGRHHSQSSAKPSTGTTSPCARGPGRPARSTSPDGWCWPAQCLLAGSSMPWMQVSRSSSR